jgi:ABC-2 type transport system permease protein
MIGVPPSLEEALRIFVYTGVSIIYIGFWMALAMLFSIIFKRITTSALAGIAVWMFLVFFMSLIAGLAADRIAPVEEGVIESELRHERLERAMMRVSPATLYNEATITMLQPNIRRLGPVLMREVVGLMPGPLPLVQSLLLIWPHLIVIIALTVLCFAVSYIRFMRQEIRAP